MVATATRKAIVRCTFEIEVEIPADVTDPIFYIEESSCPGTGIVGSSLSRIISENEMKSTCWACNLQGRNELISLDGVPVDRSE